MSFRQMKDGSQRCQTNGVEWPRWRALASIRVGSELRRPAKARNLLLLLLQLACYSQIRCLMHHHFPQEKSTIAPK